MGYDGTGKGCRGNSNCGRQDGHGAQSDPEHQSREQVP